VDGHVLNVVDDAGAQLVVAGQQVGDHLVLPVDPDRPAHRVVERDPVPGAVELQVDAAVLQPLPVETIAQPHLAQHLDGRLLEHTGTDPARNVLTGLALDHHRVDTAPCQQMGEEKAGRTCADDGHGGVQPGVRCRKIRSVLSHRRLVAADRCSLRSALIRSLTER
jgi:hypothetical protein